MHNGGVEFEFDPAKAQANLRKHGVSFSHAEQALRDPMAFTIEDPDAIGEQRFVSLGMDALGRVLVVVHTQREERTRVISARKASRGESEQYHA
ncbi:MAG: BrnT family toxin [Polaromonas sp.]|nr:BrnT family toxin [Polaromonas sp.]